MIFLCYRRYSWQFDSFWIAKSHIHNNGFCGFNSWQVEQEPVSLVHPWFTPFRLYIFRFLHQTTTYVNCGAARIRLYIFRFLHQTTTFFVVMLIFNSCISFVSYIKPQRAHVLPCSLLGCISFVSYIKPQLLIVLMFWAWVVYLSFPTSNHNCVGWVLWLLLLYIFRFLHQTTTFNV